MLCHMKRVSEICSDWELKFSEVENFIKKRFELRKINAHYMKKWINELKKNIKFNKRKEESLSDILKFESNEEI